MHLSLNANRGLVIGLWAAQVVVAISFCAGGVMKIAMPVDQLAGIWPWTGQIAPIFLTLLGIIDLAGGAGVLLPSLTRIKPRLTLWAAAGCIALQLCAMAFHASRGELQALPVNAVFIALNAFILWGRGARSLTPRPA